MKWYLACALSAVVATGSAWASEVSVLSTVATRAAFDVLVPTYERQSGNTVHVAYDSGASVNKRIAGGEVVDVVVNPSSNLANLAKAGAVQAEPWATLGVARASLAYRSGSATPDISSDEAFKTLMLSTPKLGISDPAAGGASATYVMSILKRLGIDEAMRGKLVLVKPGDGAEPVADGRAPLSIAMTSEVAAYPGVSSVPIFPQDPQASVAYAASVSAKAEHADAARSLLRFLRSPDAEAVLAAKGFARN